MPEQFFYVHFFREGEILTQTISPNVKVIICFKPQSFVLQGHANIRVLKFLE